MLGLDLHYLHHRHFATRVSHFPDSPFVVKFTLWQVARKTFIGLNLVEHVSLPPFYSEYRNRGSAPVTRCGATVG